MTGASDMPGAPCRELKDDSKEPGQSFDLEYFLGRRVGDANCRSMLGDFWKAQVDLNFKCNVLKATVQSAFFRAHALWQATREASQRMNASLCKCVRTDWPVAFH